MFTSAMPLSVPQVREVAVIASGRWPRCCREKRGRDWSAARRAGELILLSGRMRGRVSLLARTIVEAPDYARTSISIASRAMIVRAVPRSEVVVGKGRGHSPGSFEEARLFARFSTSFRWIAVLCARAVMDWQAPDPLDRPLLIGDGAAPGEDLPISAVRDLVLTALE